MPAYRGTAYVVLENLPLQPFGNRVPQFSFEVCRPEQPDEGGAGERSRDGVRVALMPGTGEYAFATTPVNYVLSRESWCGAPMSIRLPDKPISRYHWIVWETSCPIARPPRLLCRGSVMICAGSMRVETQS